MKRIINVMRNVFMMIVCVLMMPQTAFAAELPAVTVPVRISLSGTLPEREEEFTVKLEAEKSGYPMPEGTKNSIYSMTITGAGKRNIPAITYEKVGIYSYTIYQVRGTNRKCTYDGTVYSLTVYVTNAEDGSGLEAAAVLCQEDENEKQTEAEFVNRYETEHISPPGTNQSGGTPKTGDEINVVWYLVLAGISAAGFAKMRRKLT